MRRATFHLVGRHSELPWTAQCHRTSIRGEEPWSGAFPRLFGVERTLMKHLLRKKNLTMKHLFFKLSSCHMLIIGGWVLQQISSRWLEPPERQPCDLRLEIRPLSKVGGMIFAGGSAVLAVCTSNLRSNKSSSPQLDLMFFAGFETNEIAPKRLKRFEKKRKKQVSNKIH